MENIEASVLPSKTESKLLVMQLLTALTKEGDRGGIKISPLGLISFPPRTTTSLLLPTAIVNPDAPCAV
jgi:hypothetical protein